MQAPFDNIVQHLFHQPSLHSVTVGELENMAVQHPYFAAAHFLLLKKMQETAHPQFTSQLHKTTIYFNNPLWLQFLLQPETVANFTVSEQPPFIINSSIETSVEPAEEHSNGYTIETLSEKAGSANGEEKTHETAAINIPETVTDEPVQADAPVEHGSIMDVITEVFSDPNPLYNMEHVEPVNNVSTEETYQHATKRDDEVHEEIVLPEQLVQNETGVTTTSSDPWIDITNNAMHEEIVAPEQHTEEINSSVEEEIKEHAEALQEHINNVNTKQEEVIASEQHTQEINSTVQEEITEQHVEAVQEHNDDNTKYEHINSAVTEEVKELPAEISMGRSDDDNYEVHITPEPDVHEQINTTEPGHSSWPVDESMTSAVSEFHSDDPVEMPQVSTENIFIETPVAEVKNKETMVNAMTPEQTGDHYIDGALEADATDHVHEITADQLNNTDLTAKTEEPNFIKTIIETPAAKTDILFEPYHTVDYFASQGIKLSKMEADSKDKFGRQLKSFTEWLKSMKRLPPSTINKNLTQNEESRVVEDANHSIENKEVITEAMAEVFEKQAMYEKAADIYKKLSLLNPAKSAYFAARIEALKH
jgi:hypothetical protein